VERIGIFYRLKPGTQEEYKRRHDNIWPEMRTILSEAGIRNYSIWNYGEMLFGYYETEDNEKTQRILNNSDVFIKWRKFMEDIIVIDPETGEKEYFMKLMFYHE